MATLADELENDFAASGSEDGDGQQNGDLMDLQDHDDDYSENDDASMHDVGDTEEAEEERDFRIETDAKLRASGTVKTGMESVSKFMKTMEPVLEEIARYQATDPKNRAIHTGLVEDDPQYLLLTRANTLATSIDDQTIEVHKFIRDHYSPRFSELEKLLTNPLEYAKTVAILGNGPMDQASLKQISNSTNNISKQPLNTVLTGPKLMTVTVEATITKGTPLSPSELSLVLAACSTMLRLDQAKHILTSYVQSQMDIFAPNLTMLIGSLTAAQLLNARGGLKALSNTSASNLPSIGTKRAAHAGFATNVGIRNQGFIYNTEFVKDCRPELRKQAMRIVSAKTILAARADYGHAAPDGSLGSQLIEDCERRLDKLKAPPPNRGHRALAAPEDKVSKKRGGRRAQKAKEATAMTDMRKEQNRMAMGHEEREVYAGDGSTGLGMLGQSGVGHVRALKVDQKTRAKLSKKNPGWGLGGTGAGTASNINTGGTASVIRGHGLRTSGVATSLGSATAGTASSIAFTPKQGLELVDPKAREEMARRHRADEDKYFRDGTFTQVGASNGDGGFKKPMLPPKRV